MWHWAGWSVENVQRRFGFFQVKRTTFAFTADSRVNGVWPDFRIWRHWFGNRMKLLSENSTLGKLLLVMPATNAVSELGSFSALKRVKTYLRSTTGDSRLNHLMMLHVHKDKTDALTLVDVANDFAGEKENWKELFGKLAANSIPNKFSISSKSTQTEY